jgi:hypothetical protein
MGILNKRNAVLGWAAWTVGKAAMKNKARSTASGGSGGRKKGAIAAGLVALGGTLLFWRRKRDDEPE